MGMQIKLLLLLLLLSTCRIPRVDYEQSSSLTPLLDGLRGRATGHILYLEWTLFGVQNRDSSVHTKKLRTLACTIDICTL